MKEKPINRGRRHRRHIATHYYIMTENRATLHEFLLEETAFGVNEDVRHLTGTLQKRPGVRAVIFYGSGLWKEAGNDTVYDFYVIVDSHRAFDDKRILAWAGSILPPNVYYEEVLFREKTLRCKLAVLTWAQFLRAARGRNFTPHIWARFSQPCRILHARTEADKRQLVDAFASSILCFHQRALIITEEPTLETLWVQGLRSTYADELRSEKPGWIRNIYQASRHSFDTRSRLALPLVGDKAYLSESGLVKTGISPFKKHLCRLAIYGVRPMRKAVVLTRFIKAAFTFSGGLDYARWKIERQSGIRIEISDFNRRHPLICGLYLFFKALRSGGMK